MHKKVYNFHIKNSERYFRWLSLMWDHCHAKAYSLCPSKWPRPFPLPLERGLNISWGASDSLKKWEALAVLNHMLPGKSQPDWIVTAPIPVESVSSRWPDCTVWPGTFALLCLRPWSSLFSPSSHTHPFYNGELWWLCQFI